MLDSDSNHNNNSNAIMSNVGESFTYKNSNERKDNKNIRLTFKIDVKN